MTGDLKTALEHSSPFESLLSTLVRRIRDEIPEVREILLGGSYGRGEGVFSCGGGVINDLDITLCFAKYPSLSRRKKIRALKKDLESTKEIPHLDVMSESIASLTQTPLTMARYDLLSAGRVLWSAEPRQTIALNFEPPFPAYEILNLLVNRAVTLLEGNEGVSNSLSPELKMRQIAKVYWALADSQCYRRGCYKTLYRDKKKAIADDSQAPQQFREILPLIERAWSLELDDTEKEVKKISTLWSIVREHYSNELLMWLPSRTSSNPRNILSFHRLYYSAVALVRGRPVKWRVEEDMLNLIFNPKNDEAWLKSAEKLITRWYQS